MEVIVSSILNIFMWFFFKTYFTKQIIKFNKDKTDDKAFH